MPKDKPKNAESSECKPKEKNKYCIMQTAINVFEIFIDYSHESIVKNKRYLSEQVSFFM
jgi:hypothetical protein